MTGTPDGVGLGGATLGAETPPDLAMAMLVMGLGAHRAIAVQQRAGAYKAFAEALRAIGADIE